MFAQKNVFAVVCFSALAVACGSENAQKAQVNSVSVPATQGNVVYTCEGSKGSTFQLLQAPFRASNAVVYTGSLLTPVTAAGKFHPQSIFRRDFSCTGNTRTDSTTFSCVEVNNTEGYTVGISNTAVPTLATGSVVLKSVEIETLRCH